ncbi:PAS domain-containing protein [Silicimonas algicola]|uniref:PAS domain-containing protein n=1 Tax=Silicimonas algicola TaxID=1826607 RepID=UPI0013DFB732|nr:PAS domain-containing protein [Silicimonas algicola]
MSWSPELIRLYGLKQAPTAEDGFSALVHPEDRVRVEGETSTYLGSDLTTYSHSFRIVRPDGAVRVMLDRGVIDRDAAGNVRVIRGLNIDVTDQARAGFSMQHGAAAGVGGQPEQAHLAPHAVPTGVFEWDIRADKVQRIASDYPGMPKTEGAPETFEHVAKAVHPADREAFRAAVTAALTSPDGKYWSRHRYAGPKGAECWFVENGRVEFDTDRTPIRMIGFAHAIPEQEHPGQEPTDADAVLAALFGGAPVGLGVWDSEFRFQYVNPMLASINGLPSDVHIGRRPDELLPDLVDFERLYRRWGEILETG